MSYRGQGLPGACPVPCFPTWSSPRDASLPSFGSQRAWFPALAGTMKALRLPTCASAVAYFVHFRRPRDPSCVCVRHCARGAVALLEGRRSPPGPGSWMPATRAVPAHSRGRQWDLSGLQVIHPVSLLRSWTPVEPMCPCLGGHIGAAPTSGTVKASDDKHFGAQSRSFDTCSPTLRVSCCHSRARLASGWLAGLYQEGVEPSGSLRKVSDHTVVLLSCSPDATQIAAVLLHRQSRQGWANSGLTRQDFHPINVIDFSNPWRARGARRTSQLRPFPPLRHLVRCKQSSGRLRFPLGV